MRYHGEEALGLVETLAIVPVIEATDKMLKAADVELVALEAGGSTLCTVFVKGDVAACRSAVEAGAAAAEKNRHPDGQKRYAPPDQGDQRDREYPRYRPG